MKAAAEASTHEPRWPSGSCYKIVMIKIGNSQKAARKRNNWIEARTKEINRAMVKFMYFSLQPRLSFIKQFSFFPAPAFASLVVLLFHLLMLTKQFHFQYEIISKDNFNGAFVALQLLI